MRIMPLDIHQKQFSRSLRGFDEREVDEFLDQVADELERLFKENIDQAEKLQVLEEKLREYQGMERTLHNALLSAQKSADDLMRTTRQEAETVLRDAELKAKEIIHTALIDKQKASTDLARIKQAEVQFRSDYRQLLETSLADIAEVKLPGEVTALVERGSEVAVSEAEPVSQATSETSGPSEPWGTSAPEVEEVGEELLASSAERPKASSHVSSLYLGDLGSPDFDPDATVEFNVAEFGFGERESDLDIESID